MKKEQREVIFYGNKEEAGGCILDTEVPAAEFYNTLFQDILDGKFTNVNELLYQALRKHNKKQEPKIENRKKWFQEPLASVRHTHDSDEMILLKDWVKVMKEIGIVWWSEGWLKQKWFSHGIIAYSKKETARILAFGYISDEGKIRIFIRYKTLHQPTRTAEEVINTIRSRLAPFLEN